MQCSTLRRTIYAELPVVRYLARSFTKWQQELNQPSQLLVETDFFFFIAMELAMAFLVYDFIFTFGRFAPVLAAYSFSDTVWYWLLPLLAISSIINMIFYVYKRPRFGNFILVHMYLWFCFLAIIALTYSLYVFLCTIEYKSTAENKQQAPPGFCLDFRSAFFLSGILLAGVIYTPFLVIPYYIITSGHFVSGCVWIFILALIFCLFEAMIRIKHKYQIAMSTAMEVAATKKDVSDESV
jgi:hypothetical protein